MDDPPVRRAAASFHDTDSRARSPQSCRYERRFRARSFLPPGAALTSPDREEAAAGLPPTPRALHRAVETNGHLVGRLVAPGDECGGGPSRCGARSTPASRRRLKRRAAIQSDASLLETRLAPDPPHWCGGHSPAKRRAPCAHSAGRWRRTPRGLPTARPAPDRRYRVPAQHGSRAR